MSMNRSFQDFLKQCGVQADIVNSHVEPVWAKKFFEKIIAVCYNTNFSMIYFEYLSVINQS